MSLTKAGKKRPFLFLNSLFIYLVLLLCALLLFFSYKNEYNQTRDASKLLLDTIAAQESRESQDIFKILESWRKDVESSTTLRSNPCDSSYIKVLGENLEFSTYGAISSDGDFICSREPLPGKVNISDRDYFQKVLDEKKPVVSGYIVGRVTNKRVYTFSVPVFYEEDEVQTVLLVGVDLAWMNKHLGELNFPKGSEFLSTDKNGVILGYYPDGEEKIGTSRFSAKIFSLILSRNSGSVTFKGEDGIRRIYSFHPLTFVNGEQDISIFQIVGLPFSTVKYFYGSLLIILIFVFTVLMFGVKWGSEKSGK